MENRKGSLDLSHELTANLSVWGHQCRTLLQVLRNVQGKVCWAPAVVGDMPEMTVMGMKGDLQQSGFGASTGNTHEEGTLRGFIHRAFPYSHPQPPPGELFIPFMTEFWGLDRSEMGFCPLPSP